VQQPPGDGERGSELREHALRLGDALGLVASVVTTLVMAQAVVLIAFDLRAHRRGSVSVLVPR
jgi:hypothetical protein